MVWPQQGVQRVAGRSIMCMSRPGIRGPFNLYGDSDWCSDPFQSTMPDPYHLTFVEHARFIDCFPHN